MKDIGAICWVAGGCVRDYFTTGYLDSDIDLFFPNQDEFDKASKYFITGSGDLTKSATIRTENERVLKITHNGKKIDLVKKFFATPDETIANFDFTVCCAAVTSDSIFVHERFFIDNARKSLVINSLPFPFSSMMRMQKYIRKGYHICIENMGKMIESVRAYQIPESTEIVSEMNIEPMSGDGLFAGMD